MKRWSVMDRGVEGQTEGQTDEKLEKNNLDRKSSNFFFFKFQYLTNKAMSTTRPATGSLRMARCVGKPFPSPITWWYIWGCTRMCDLSVAACATKHSGKRLTYKGTKKLTVSVSKSAIGVQVPAVAQIQLPVCPGGNGKGQHGARRDLWPRWPQPVELAPILEAFPLIRLQQSLALTSKKD